MDLGYKIQMDPLKTFLTHTRKNSILTFYLSISEKTLDSRSL